MKNNQAGIFRIGLGSLIGFSIAFLLIMTVFVTYQKARLSEAFVEHPSKKKEQIIIPFNSGKDGQTAEYTYGMTIHYTALSSGKFHIIPDDCIVEIKVNGKILTAKQFSKGDCDCVNGFYVDLKDLLRHGDNQLLMKVRNTQGFYGLSVTDQTFYEKYVLCGYLLFLLCMVKFKVLLSLISSVWRSIWASYKALLILWICLFCLFMTSLVSTVYLEDLAIWYWVLIVEVLLLVFIPAVTFVYRELQHGKVISIVWIGMFFLFASYLFLLPHTLYSYDYQGHIDYVHYIVNHAEAPVSWGAWSFYHPSLYYRFAAGLWNVLNVSDQLSNTDFLKTIQAFSLLLFILYGYWSLKTIDVFFKHLASSIKGLDQRVTSRIHVLTAVLFLCWPSNSIFAVRVGNDMMFDLFYAISFYFTLQWWQSNRFWHFFLALVFASLDIWSKTNGFILLGVIALLFIFKYLNLLRVFGNQNKRKLNNLYCYKLILLCLFSMLSFYYSFHEKIERYYKDPKTRLVVGNANGLGSDLIVKSDIQSFINFNAVKFVEIPFTSSYDDDKGRNSFWFFMLKSSLFGEFKFDTALIAVIARLLSFSFLLLLGLAIWGWIKSIFSGKVFVPLLTNLLMMLCSMMLFRVFYPYSSSSDFRYIFPALLPAVLFAGYGLISCAKYRLAYLTGIGVYVIFVTGAFAFQVLTILSG